MSELHRKLGELRQARTGRIGHGSRCLDLVAEAPHHPSKLHALAFVSSSQADLLRQIDEQRVSFVPRSDSAGAGPAVAFVFPGSGNHFPGMGRGLSAEFPEVFRKQDAENGRLRSQLLPDLFWNAQSLDRLDHRTLILGQVSLGTIVSDLLQSFGIEPAAAHRLQPG